MDVKGYIGPILLDTDENILFVADEDSPSIIAINLINQQILWEKRLIQLETYEFGCLIKHGDVLYVAAQELVALSSVNGEEIWQTPKTGRLECPVVMNDKIFVRNIDTSLYGFALDFGKELGRMTIQANTIMKSEPHKGPIISGDLIILPITDHKLNAYNPD